MKYFGPFRNGPFRNGPFTNHFGLKKGIKPIRNGPFYPTHDHSTFGTFESLLKAERSVIFTLLDRKPRQSDLAK